jgi:hypothetical protein
MKQVAAGVTRQGQLRKNEDGNALLFGAIQQADDALGVEGAVSHPHLGDRCRDANETVRVHQWWRNQRRLLCRPLESLPLLRDRRREKSAAFVWCSATGCA